MSKKISIVTTIFLLLLGLQTSIYAAQDNNNKTVQQVKSQTKIEKSQAKTTKDRINKKIKVEPKKVNNNKDNETNKIVNNKTKNTNNKVSKITKSNKIITTKKSTNQNKEFNSYAYLGKNQKQKVFNEFYNETKHIKYKMGGTGQNGIDCSAFTQKMFKEKFDYALSRSTLTQVNEGIEVKKSELQPGDLVFFKTSKIDKHVGVYTGNGEFLHASIKGIQYTKLDKPFYKDSYWTARRVIN
jgi:murein DD-endopeptidase / murein LD-carboxypeptidase